MDEKGRELLKILPFPFPSTLKVNYHKGNRGNEGEMFPSIPLHFPSFSIPKQWELELINLYSPGLPFSPFNSNRPKIC